MSTHIPSCLHCGSPCTEHALSDLCMNNDPSSLSDDIDRLDRTIDRLRILRLERCRQLNTVRSSTKSLPNEILLSIFENFYSSFTSEDFPQLILGSVCYHWRNLVNNAPQFWQTINLEFGDTRGISAALSLLEVFKQRNGGSFEFAEFNFENLRRQTGSYERLLSSFRGLSTVLSIHLQTPPVDIVQAINNYPALHKVSLLGPDWDDIPFPQFRPKFSFPWSALTNLQLTRIQVDVCCDLLLGCPNLVEFHSSTTSKPNKFDISPSPRHAREMHFPHLQHLTWGHYNSEWDDNFLSFYRFPALQHFCWEGADFNHSSQLFREFTTLLPQSCQTLQLSASPDEIIAELDSRLLRVIARPIKRLICSGFYPRTLAKAFEALQDPTFIPSLTFFRWEHDDDFDIEPDDLTRINPAFKGGIQGRKEIGCRFRMEIEGMEFPKGYNKENSHELIGSGFDFEITEDGCWIISF